MGVTEQLARFAIETPDSKLASQAVIASAKAKILDTIGVMLAGSTAQASHIALEVARETGGQPEATVIGSAGKVSMPLAGFVNGVSAHVHQYDDHTLGVGHVSACVLPGCLAVAEHLNLSGRKLIEAYVVGFEVTCRMARGLQRIERGPS